MPEDQSELSGLLKKVREFKCYTKATLERRSGWVITRRLQRPADQPWPDNGNSGYLEVLPTFGGQTFVDLIAAGVEQGRKMSLLNIGCGAGLALLDLRERFSPDQLEIVGLGNRRDTEKPLDDIARDVSRKSTAGDLEKAKIRFIYGNFVNSREILGSRSYDIITAVACLDWIPYPGFALFKKVWRLLKGKGVAFVAPFNLRLIEPGKKETTSFFRFLKEKGLEVEGNRGGVAFRKTQPNIPNIFASTLGLASTDGVILRKGNPGEGAER